MPTLNLSAYELARLATKGFLATITALFQSGICKKKNQYNFFETCRPFENGRPKKGNHEINIRDLFIKIRTRTVEKLLLLWFDFLK